MRPQLPQSRTGWSVMACGQACNTVGEILLDEQIGEYLDKGNEEKNYGRAIRSGKFEMMPSTPRDRACRMSLSVSAV